MYERMLNKQETPGIEQMTKFCGENAERFSLLNEWLVSSFDTEKKIVFPYGNKYGWTLLGVLASVEMPGEEWGWLGWLFPKLEKQHGTKTAMRLLALIRTIVIKAPCRLKRRMQSSGRNPAHTLIRQ